MTRILSVVDGWQPSNKRTDLIEVEARLKARTLIGEEILRLSRFEGFVDIICAQEQALRQAKSQLTDMTEHHRDMVASMSAAHSERLTTVQSGSVKSERNATAVATALQGDLRRSLDVLTRKHVADVAALSAQLRDGESALMEVWARLGSERGSRTHFELLANIALSDCDELRRQLSVVAQPGVHRGRLTPWIHPATHCPFTRRSYDRLRQQWG